MTQLTTYTVPHLSRTNWLLALRFMPEDEATSLMSGLLGTVSGRDRHLCSKFILGAAAREAGSVVFTVDHHRGSEENQPGWEWHDPTLVDPAVGRIDTLPFFRRTITGAGLEEEVVGIVGRAPTVARHWGTPLAFLFIDGGHTDEHVTNDYEGFARWVSRGGILVIHDVFERPEDGGQPPWRVYRRAVTSGDWDLVTHRGSMRVLRRTGGDAGDEVR
jgi:hypothetical protein